MKAADVMALLDDWQHTNFDPTVCRHCRLTAALRAVLELAEEWRYKGEYGWGAWQEGQGPDLEGHVLDQAAADLRTAITAALTPEQVQS